jgi:hypothetical protein
MDEAALDLPFPLPHDDVVFVNGISAISESNIAYFSRSVN